MSTSLEALIARLVGRGHRGMDLGLDRVRAALASLKNPHLAVPAVVVAGTNGKGSTCAMLEAISLAAGVRVGMTTSPHLMRFSERIRISGVPIADDAFAAALSAVFDGAPEALTFFETLTCAAFVAFRDAELELAILEVGLGGRLDATNVVPAPLATAVTSIAEGDGSDNHLEHANLLGSTVEAIAREKAGIFKRGVPAVVGPLAPRARREVLNVADEVGMAERREVMRSSSRRSTEGRWTRPILVEPRDGGRVLLGLPGALPIEAPLGLPGRHQLENAAVASALAWLVGEWQPSLRASIGDGIARATWPGRLERLPAVAGRPDIWLDAAHNLDGARVLAEAWRALGTPPAQTILVFGALADKAYEPVLRELSTIADRRVYVGPRGRAPAPLEALAAVAPGAVAESPEVAIDRALAIAGPEDRVLVAGSIYLVGDVRAHVLGLPRDPAMGL